ncbi:MAG: hypothetical protein M1838_004613 [Thelocarpon superellum]|nr:MAG: hypothetical protein M1838_004613 [Thelocarpon superellum]
MVSQHVAAGLFGMKGSTVPRKPSPLRMWSGPISPVVPFTASPTSPGTPAVPTSAADLGFPPFEPSAWRWTCHACEFSYPLGATRRCLKDGHVFCQSGSEKRVRRQKKKRHQVCAMDFDYSGWAHWRDWQKDGKPLSPVRDCGSVCSYPKECRFTHPTSAHLDEPEDEEWYVDEDFAAEQKRAAKEKRAAAARLAAAEERIVETVITVTNFTKPVGLGLRVIDEEADEDAMPPTSPLAQRYRLGSFRSQSQVSYERDTRFDSSNSAIDAEIEAEFARIAAGYATADDRDDRDDLDYLFEECLSDETVLTALLS